MLANFLSRPNFPSKISLLGLAAAVVVGLTLRPGSAQNSRLQPGQAREAETVILDDSAFYGEMPKGTVILQAPARLQEVRPAPPSPPGAGRPPAPTSTGGPRGSAMNPLPAGSWLYNNSALLMRSQAYLYAYAEVPQEGLYYLFVRSHGGDGSSFRIMLGDQQTQEVFGNEPLRWKTGGQFRLKKGRIEVTLSRVVLGKTSGSVFDALVLTRNPNFTEEDLRRRELPEDVELVKEYPVLRTSAVKFGDVDGDGKSDFFALTSNYDGAVYNHQGKLLWSYENEPEGGRQRAGFEAPGLLWDLDGDRRAEVIHYRLSGGKEWLTVSEGATGRILHQTPWPVPPMPHEYNNFRLSIANFDGRYPNVILAFTDSGGLITITAFTSRLEQLWQHREEKKKDHLGHYAHVADLDGDGKDEVVASAFVLNSAGEMLWRRFDFLDDNHDHCDSFRFHDLDGDGKPEILAPVSEVGVMAFRALTGEILWRRPAEHAQQLEVGNFLEGTPTPHIAVNARTYARVGEAGLAGQVFWYDRHGNLVKKWPANPLNGNPDFVKGDWKGEGSEALFWYKFRMLPDGSGQLCFKQDVYHMFDFLGNGAEQVIARGPEGIQIYACKHAQPKPARRGWRYWQRVANHTHY